MTHFNILISSATNNLNEINNTHFKNIINELKHIEDYLQKKNDELKVRENTIIVKEIELETKLLEITDFKKVSVYKSLSDQVLQKDLEINILIRKLKRSNSKLEKNKTSIISNTKVLDTMNSNLIKGLNTIELIINNSDSNQLESTELINDTSIESTNNKVSLTNNESVELIDDESVESIDNKSVKSMNNESDKLTDNKSVESMNNDSGKLIDNESVESMNNDSGKLIDNESSELIDNESSELIDNKLINSSQLTEELSNKPINIEIEFFEEEINGKSYYFSSDNLVYKKLKDESIGKRILGSFTEDDSGNLDIDWKNK